jgi:DNA-binding Lrp family transcriptional regulator
MHEANPKLDDDAIELVHRLQMGIPVVQRPFAAVGAELGLTEDTVLSSLRRLEGEGMIRRLGAIYDTSALGYDSTLVAMQVSPSRLDEAASIVNEHPGVSHNYARDHRFNLWFTIAVPADSSLGLAETVDRIHAATAAVSTRMLPSIRVFKIGVRLDLTERNRPADKETEPAKASESAGAAAPGEDDIRAVRVLQRDLQRVPEPFREMAMELGCGVEELAAIADRHRDRGWLRRIALTLHHRRAGYQANAMGVWIVPSHRLDEVGPRMASFRSVSHCYQRPSYPDWPYNLYTMIHRRTRAECDEVVDALRRATGVDRGLAVYSTREYMKRRIRYFDPAFDTWEKRILSPAPDPPV